jgi:hypothetical protein
VPDENVQTMADRLHLGGFRPLPDRGVYARQRGRDYTRPLGIDSLRIRNSNIAKADIPQEGYSREFAVPSAAPSRGGAAPTYGPDRPADDGKDGRNPPFPAFPSRGLRIAGAPDWEKRVRGVKIAFRFDFSLPPAHTRNPAGGRNQAVFMSPSSRINSLWPSPAPSIRKNKGKIPSFAGEAPKADVPAPALGASG